MVRLAALLISACALTSALAETGNDALKNAELRCDGLASPLAVDSDHPLFTWKYGTTPPGKNVPLAARVIVQQKTLALVPHSRTIWDSGWLPDSTLSMRYNGPTLARDATYTWTVQVRDAAGSVTTLDTVGTFATAAEAWSAQWIQAAWSTERDGAELDGSHPLPMFRREFTLRSRPVEATLRIAGLGQYEVQLNDTGALVPGALRQSWTDYRKLVTYDTYNIVEKMKPGNNVVSVLLGNGMYNVQKTNGRYTKFEGSYGPPKLIAELRVRYADGSAEVIATDPRWQAAPSPIIFDSIYGGEDFDARRWPAGWDRAGATSKAWQAAIRAPSPGGRLAPSVAPMVTHHGSRAEVSKRVLSPSRTVYDMGQNLAGWPTVSVRGPAGAVLRLTAGELLNPDGTVSQASTGQPQWWSYTLSGNGEETWTPRFSYWGFRYIQTDWVTADSHDSTPKPSGAANRGEIVQLLSNQLSSDSPVTGDFASSSDLLNRIHGIIIWAMHNNEMSLFTDCPHRERLGWLEETHLVGAGLLYNNDLQRLYTATEQNISDAQGSDGMVSTIAPQYTKFGPKYPVYDDSPEWGSAAILSPWSVYKFYGDSSLLKTNYQLMQRYIGYLESRAQDGIVAYGLGDWYDIGPGGPGMEKNTTLGVTGTLMLYEDAVTLAKIAKVLHHDEDASRYTSLASREQDAYNRRFWDPSKGYYDRGSQTANAMPLALGIVPEEHRERVLAHVVADIHAHGEHITTGEVGYPYLVRVLEENGLNDLLLTMALKTDPPSYGSQLMRGATSLTEAWDANPKNSQDHFMLGDVEEWFYRGLGGIDVDLSRTEASERITIQPHLVGGLAWVSTGYDSQLGKIESNWHQSEGKATITITIPAGVEATVKIPAVKDMAINAQTSPGVSLVRRDPNTATYRVNSGTHDFYFAF